SSVHGSPRRPTSSSTPPARSCTAARRPTAASPAGRSSSTAMAAPAVTAAAPSRARTRRRSTGAAPTSAAGWRGRSSSRASRGAPRCRSPTPSARRSRCRSRSTPSAPATPPPPKSWCGASTSGPRRSSTACGCCGRSTGRRPTTVTSASPASPGRSSRRGPRPLRTRLDRRAGGCYLGLLLQHHIGPPRHGRRSRAMKPLALGIALAAAFASSAFATTFVRVRDEALADRAQLVVVGTVVARETPRGAMATDYRVRVEEVLAGGATKASELVVRVPGGGDGPVRRKIWAAPIFATGERVLLFLNRGSAGTWRVHQLFLGAFHEVQAGERTLAVRDLSEASEVKLSAEGE